MRTRAVLAAAAGLCLVVAVGCFIVAWQSADTSRHLIPFRADRTSVQAAQPARPWTRPSDQIKPGSKRAPLRVPLRMPPPVRVSIPAIGLSARVVPVGVNSARQLVMPDPSVAGWYRQGPAPGALGAAVIVGHVDSDEGPAVFYRLTGIRRGDTVQVERGDGSRSTFVISRVTVVDRRAFPSQAVYNGPTRGAAIRLITCTGPFDTNAGYLDTVIAWGHATSS